MSDKPSTLTINEIYCSIQGESTWVGLPCVFVRLTFCDLRCNYCDTAYAFYEGRKWALPEIVEQVIAYQCPLVEITGGEPLLQKNVLPLMTQLCDRGLIEGKNRLNAMVNSERALVDQRGAKGASDVDDSAIVGEPVGGLELAPWRSAPPAADIVAGLHKPEIEAADV